VQGRRSHGQRQALPGVVALDPARPLRRSRQRLLAGVCGGLADWLGWDRTLVRVLFVLVSILSAAFPGILVYVVLWLVIPEA
jgi:phage shock protein C